MEVFEATYFPEKFNVNGLLYRTDTNELYKNVGTSDIPSFTNIQSARGYLGDGSDGTVIISANTTLDNIKQYVDLTINSGVTLTASGHVMVISIQGTLTINGTISMTGKGFNANASFYNISNSGLSGGSGGYGGGAGGAPHISATPGLAGESGNGEVIITPPSTLKHPSTVLSIIPISGGAFDGGTGGTGRHSGGTGSAFALGTGGAGGAGGISGGTIIIIANHIVNNGSIVTNGENGGAGIVGNNSGTGAGMGGGGGGGGGSGGAPGLIVLLYDNSNTGSGSITANNGTGGSGGVGGSGGSIAGYTGITGSSGSTNVVTGTIIEQEF